MQAVYREYEQWLGDEEIQENIMREYKRAETKLEKCLPFEETLVNLKFASTLVKFLSRML